MVKRVEQLLIAEYAAEYRAEDHAADAAGDKDLAEPHSLELIHQKSHYRKHKSLAEIGEHDAVEQRIDDRHKRGRVDLIVGRHAVYLGEEFERSCERRILHLGGRGQLLDILGMRRLDLDLLYLRELSHKLLAAAPRHPTGEEKAAVILCGVFPDIKQVAQGLYL